MEQRFGAYGKIPTLGDFFRIGAAADRLTVWDGWVQTTLLAARQALGPGFDAAYMRAPVWRFALPPGVIGDSGVVGVLMPSVDRVGRLFPLTLLAQTGYDPGAPLRTLIWQAGVLDAAEALALDCLDDAMTREALAGRLAALTLRGAPQPVRTLQDGTSLTLAHPSPDLMCADLALDLAQGQLQRSCVWQATVDGAARLVLSNGLVQGAAAVGLFDIGAMVEEPA